MEFTFHYVSILIRSVYRGKDKGGRIYIPLCLYFNYQPESGSLTFHQIYIPLCLYFNDNPEPFVIGCKSIYIPLCLYFNVESLGNPNRGGIFTFHYVSILIVRSQRRKVCAY